MGGRLGISGTAHQNGSGCSEARAGLLVARTGFLPQLFWYFYAMQTSIDSAGRVVVPKPLRDALGLAPGTRLEASMMDGRLVLEPVAVPMRLVKRAGGLVVEAEGPLPPLTAEQVRATLEALRP